MIELKNLRKLFGDFAAVDGVTMNVARGEVLGFLGPNGAGKSTTMKMVTGFLTPTSGQAIVGGHDVTVKPLECKRLIGYLPEGAPAYPDMTPTGFLRFVAEARGVKASERTKRIEEVAERVNLRGVMQQPIETLSKGYRRRVGLAQALIHDPEVLILDEPTDGLDPNQKHEVRRLIKSLGEKKAIVLSTHILEEVEAVCTRAVIITRGRIVADERPEELLRRSATHNVVRFSVFGASDGLAASLGALPGVASVDHAGADSLTRWSVTPRQGEDVTPRVRDALRARGVRFEDFRVESGRLDDVFRSLTVGSEKGGAK